MTEPTTEEHEWKPPVVDGDFIKRKTPEEITALARDIVTGRVYFVNNPDVLRDSFGFMLMLMEFTDEGAATFGGMYAPMDKAGPRSINGQPFFFGGSLFHREDLPALFAEIDRMHEALGLPKLTDTLKDNEVSDGT